MGTGNRELTPGSRTGRSSLESFLREVRACRLCEDSLEHGVRPVLQVGEGASVLIAGQAPGRRVHASGLPFDDPSGDRLRNWLGVSSAEFYDGSKFAIVPMGFCYPGTGQSGDLPPRAECAPAWRQELLERVGTLRLTLAIGQYAVRWHLGTGSTRLTEVVRRWRDFTPHVIPMPHPSPRNNLWLRKNPWFEGEVVPYLRARISEALGR